MSAISSRIVLMLIKEKDAVSVLIKSEVVPMTREKLKQYQALKKEVKMLEESIDKLQERALNIPTVIGKVQASQKDFPYIEQHISVQMDDPKEADVINRRIIIKEKRKGEVNKLILEIEQFIASISDSTDRQIFEKIYLEGKKQREVADEIGMERSGISKKISKYIDVSHNSQK